VLREYELMGVKTQSSLALLNFGQSFIFTSSLTLMMILAANGIRAGRPRAFTSMSFRR
jgi:ABC-type transport system involved in Fe-S cluster assembly fused permease/ATPase subunit